MSILENEVELGCKTEFARLLKIERSSLYHHYTKQRKRDEADVERLVSAHIKNPRYGVPRLAIVLGWSESKTRRIRTLAGVEALRRTKRGYNRGVQEIDAPNNKLRPYWALKKSNEPWLGYDFIRLTNPELRIWVQDFTYIKHGGKFFYLAATLSLATREVLGWSFGFFHDADLVCESLEDALRNNPAPDIVHSDQGSEYLSQKHYELCKERGIVMSASDPGSPWQNGFMERFFNTFKEEMEERLKRAKTVPEMYEKIANWIYYYNYERIHTKLKMSPKDYAKKLQAEAEIPLLEVKEKNTVSVD